MINNSSAKYYTSPQNIKNRKKDYKKSLVKNIEIVPKKKKEQSENMNANNIKTFQKIKNKDWLN